MGTQDVVGLNLGDPHRLRVLKDNTMRNVFDLLTSPSGIPTVVLPGSGICVSEAANKQCVVSDTAQSTRGPAGAGDAFQTVAVSDGTQENTYDGTSNILTIGGLQGPAVQEAATPQDGQNGQDGAPEAMYIVTIGGQPYTASDIISVVFTGATGNTAVGKTTLASLQGPPGNVPVAQDGEGGDDAADSAMQFVTTGGQPYSASARSCPKARYHATAMRCSATRALAPRHGH